MVPSENELLSDGFRRVYFHHVRKTAGTSIVASFYALSGSDPRRIERSLYRYAFVRRGGIRFVGLNAQLIRGGRYFFGVSHFPSYVARPPREGTFAFTVLRDPVERVVSLYRYLRSPDSDEGFTFRAPEEERLWARGTFEEFLDRLPEDRLLGHLYMFSPTGSVSETVDVLGALQLVIRMEALTAGIEQLRKRTGLPLDVGHEQRLVCSTGDPRHATRPGPRAVGAGVRDDAPCRRCIGRNSEGDGGCSRSTDAISELPLVSSTSTWRSRVVRKRPSSTSRDTRRSGAWSVTTGFPSTSRSGASPANTRCWSKTSDAACDRQSAAWNVHRNPRSRAELGRISPSSCAPATGPTTCDEPSPAFGVSWTRTSPSSWSTTHRLQRRRNASSRSRHVPVGTMSWRHDPGCREPATQRSSACEAISSHGSTTTRSPTRTGYAG